MGKHGFKKTLSVLVTFVAFRNAGLMRGDSTSRRLQTVQQTSERQSRSVEEDMPTTLSATSNGYIVYYPYGRFSNNVQQLRNMLLLARHLRRKLLIPPLHYNEEHERVRDARVANFPQLFDWQALNRFLHPLGRNCTFWSSSSIPANGTIALLTDDDIGLLSRSENGVAPEFLNATIRNPSLWNDDDCWVLPWQFTNRNLSCPLLINRVYCVETDWLCWKTKQRLYGRIPNDWESQNAKDYAPRPKRNSIQAFPLADLINSNATEQQDHNDTETLPELMVVTALSSFSLDVLPKQQHQWATLLPIHPQLVDASTTIIHNLPVRPGGDSTVSIGAHIRRGDTSDRVPPLDEFITKLEQLVQHTNAGKLFIATDGNQDEIQRLQTNFPYAQIGCGLMDDSGRAGWCQRVDLAILIEQVTVARCTYFVGTALSSFSEEIALHRQVMTGNSTYALL